jgi:hypothetical protein
MSAVPGVMATAAGAGATFANVGSTGFIPVGDGLQTIGAGLQRLSICVASADESKLESIACRAHPADSDAG